MTMTAREIQFVRAREDDGLIGVSDADIAASLQGTLYLERVRFTLAVDNFVNAIKDVLPRWITRQQS